MPFSANTPIARSRSREAATLIAEMYIDAEGMPPTIREVADRMGLKSSGHALRYVRMAEARGLVRRVQTGPTARAHYLPVTGMVCALCAQPIKPLRSP